jgi:C1A family cysteine protease
MTTSYKLGWLRDLPDIRDFEPTNNKIPSNAVRDKKHNEVTAYLTHRFIESEVVMTGAPAAAPLSAGATTAGIPATMDLTPGFSQVENQLNLGSCTANAGVGLLEYYERAAFGAFIDASRLFLYKTTRDLLGWTGDTGAYLRTTMKAMALFGVPPEANFPYDVQKFDIEPSAFAYAWAQNYQSLSYFRLDPSGSSPQATLDRVKTFIARQHPSMFGFTVYNYGNQNGEFLFPGPTDKALGGHAVVAMGYDDNRQIGNHKGALKIRNSWGPAWGQGGYGWLPYDYVIRGLAVDFWSLFRAEYIGNGPFV